MKRLLTALVVAAAVMGPAGFAWGQVESHFLPREWPVKLLPSYVENLPTVGTRQLTTPLLHEKVAEGKVSVDPAEIDRILRTDEDGKPAKQGHRDATTFSEMCTGPRKVIEKTFRGQHDEAVEAGRPLLARSKGAYGDFTWDFLANAVAWSLIQQEKYEEAEAVHRSIASYLSDADVRRYHIRYAGAIREVLKPDAKQPADARRPKPEDLKKPAMIPAMLRRGLRDEVTQVKRSLELMGKAKTVSSRLGNMNVAYGNLRFLMAIDPEVAGALLKEFKAQADTLVTDTADRLLKRAASQREHMERLERTKAIRRSDYKWWNVEVGKLWGLVRETKRLCRIHNYLERLNLTGSACVEGPFNQAHDLLFAPGTRDKVYRLVGGRTFGGLDMRRRGPAADLMVD